MFFNSPIVYSFLENSNFDEEKIEKIYIVDEAETTLEEYDDENYENIAIIGGGIGVFPLYELAKCAQKDNKNVNTYLNNGYLEVEVTYEVLENIGIEQEINI